MLARLLYSLVEFARPILVECVLFLLSLLAEGILGVELLSEQVVVLLVVLLYVRCDLFCMCLLEGLDGLIICFKFVKLLLVFLHASVETCLELLDLRFEVRHLGLVILLQLLLLR